MGADQLGALDIHAPAKMIVLAWSRMKEFS